MTRQAVWRAFALGILLCYPIMAVKWLPFGGGARYLNVLAAPVCLILLWQAPREQIRELLVSALRWGLPFLPFVLAWVIAQFWHAYDPLDLNPLMRLVWCSLLFVGARLVGVSYRHLAIAAGLGATVYCGVALIEVYGLGRERAWGGTYENRFGQYSIWAAVLCFLHVLFVHPKEQSPAMNALLIAAGFLGIVATLLSGSRGALLALCVLIAIALFKSMDWRRGLLAGGAILLAVAAFAFLYAPMASRIELSYQEVLLYFNEAEFAATSIGVRLELFRIAYLTLLDHPVIGPGYTSLKQLYDSHPAFGVPHPYVLEIPGFHNDWAQAVGIGGGLLLTALVVTCAALGVAAGSIFQLAFLGFAFVFSFSEIFFSNKMGLSLLMACWALYAAAEQNRKSGT
ncbi:MAG: O-antigen ligase family protein [Dechloromonas sp.]|nr:O-antigen ligase family protein [Dechloromonas sp.]